MSRTGWTLAALAGAALMLVVATWFDAYVLRSTAQQAAATFDPAPLGALTAAGSMLVAGSVLLVGVLAWRARSIVVGLAYAVVGGFIVASPWLGFGLAIQLDEGTTTFLEPLLTVAWEIVDRTGRLNAIGTIGAAMLIAGVAALVGWQRDRAVARRSVDAMSPAANPTLT